MNKYPDHNLAGLVKQCRELGIRRFKGADFEFTLGTDPFVAPIQLTHEVKEASELDKPAKLKEPKRGKDGLTADEQFDFYGEVRDARE